MSVVAFLPLPIIRTHTAPRHRAVTPRTENEARDKEFISFFQSRVGFSPREPWISFISRGLKPTLLSSRLKKALALALALPNPPARIGFTQAFVYYEIRTSRCGMQGAGQGLAGHRRDCLTA